MRLNFIISDRLRMRLNFIISGRLVVERCLRMFRRIHLRRPAQMTFHAISGLNVCRIALHDALSACVDPRLPILRRTYARLRVPAPYS